MITQGRYTYPDNEELMFTPPWNTNQDDNRDDGAGREFIIFKILTVHKFYCRTDFSFQICVCRSKL